MRDIQAELILRGQLPHLFFFPELYGYFVSPYERGLKRNCANIRQFLADFIQKRKQMLKKDPSLASKGDFLTILLTDDHFKDNDERILDECFTFFFAGSQTSAIASQNLILALLKHPHYQTKIRDELETEIIQPHLKDLMA